MRRHEHYCNHNHQNDRERSASRSAPLEEWALNFWDSPTTSTDTSLLEQLENTVNFSFSLFRPSSRQNSNSNDGERTLQGFRHQFEAGIMSESFEEDIVSFITTVMENEETTFSQKEEMVNNASALLDRLRGNRNVANTAVDDDDNDADDDSFVDMGHIAQNMDNGGINTISVNDEPNDARPSGETPVAATANNNAGPLLTCPICYESLIGAPISSTKCGHLFCHRCIIESLEASSRCPTCRREINRRSIRPVYL